MGGLNSFLKMVCIVSLYVCIVNGYPSFIEESNSQKDENDDALLEKSREKIDFQPIDTKSTINKPKMTFTVLSNSSNLLIVKEQLINFQKSQVQRIKLYSFRSNYEGWRYKKRVNGCLQYPMGYIPCPTKIVKRYPKVVINRDEHVSKPYEFKEIEIPVEVCSNPDQECNIERTHLKFANAISLCKQVYSLHNIVFTTNGETTTTTFRTEFGCRCAVYVDEKEKYSYCPKNRYHL